MKKWSSFKSVFGNLKLIFLLGLFSVALLQSKALFAQQDSGAVTESPAEDKSNLIAPSMDFVSVQKGNNIIGLKVALTAKIKSSFIKLPLLKVTFFQVTENGDKELGFVISDRSGIASFNTKGDSLETDKEGKLSFKAVFAGNKQMDPVEESVSFRRARLEIIPVEVDSAFSVTLKLVDIGTGTEKPAPEVVLGIYVHRLFNPLKVGEATTDENGECTVEIPNTLPGDAKGNIELLAKLDENELYGNMETGSLQKWGTPVSNKLGEQPRALWSLHPPLWMLLTFIILMTTVWGHYVYIVYQLFRLRKVEPVISTHVTLT